MKIISGILKVVWVGFLVAAMVALIGCTTNSKSNKHHLGNVDGLINESLEGLGKVQGLGL